MSPDRRSHKLTKASDAFYRLKADITNGHFSCGEKLPMEGLKEKYEVGIGPLREALSRLTAQGLVNFEEQCGFTIPSLSLSDFNDLYLLRTEIDAIAIKLAIERGDIAWESEVVAHWHRFYTYSNPSNTSKIKLEIWESLQRNFLFSLVKGCQSSLVVNIWNMLYDHASRYRALCFQYTLHQKAWLKKYYLEKEKLMKAMLERDTQKAITLSHKNWKSVMHKIQNILTKKGK